MILRLVYVFFEKGYQAVFRGTPDDVTRAIEYAEPKLGRATPYGLSRSVSSPTKENGMWLDFVKDNTQREPSDGMLVRDCYRLWRRDHSLIWRDPELHPLLCRFTISESGVVMSQADTPEEIWSETL